MQKIKLYPAPHLEVRVHVSDEMEADLRECRRMAAQGDCNGKECSGCSWDDVKWMGSGFCEMPAVRARILEGNYYNQTRKEMESVGIVESDIIAAISIMKKLRNEN